MVRLSNGVELPQNVLEAFKNSNNKMLCAIYRSIEDGELFTRDLRTTEFDLKLIQTIIEQNGWKKEGGEFAILDENGIVYKSNGSNFELAVDKNGYMHINGDELVIHSHKGGFVSGRTIEHVNNNYKKGLDMCFYDKDKSFGEDGFIATVSSKDIAEADKKQALTSLEISNSIGIIKENLKHNDKEKNEK